MGFYKTTGVTREVVAMKLAQSIYRSFRRNELKYDTKLKMYAIVGRKLFRIQIWRDEREVLDTIRRERERLIYPDSSSALKAIIVDIYNHHRNMEYCNTILIKFFLLNDCHIIWWDDWGNEHGYNLETTLKSWDSTKQH